MGDEIHDLFISSTVDGLNLPLLILSIRDLVGFCCASSDSFMVTNQNRAIKICCSLYLKYHIVRERIE